MYGRKDLNFDEQRLHIVLYQPEIPQNVGAIMRTVACLDCVLHLIEPFGFIFSRSDYFFLGNAKRSVLDYENKCDYVRYKCWKEFLDLAQEYNKRLIMFTPHTSLKVQDFKFKKGDMLLFGRESSGFAQDIHGKVNALVSIPMKDNCRSLNLGMTVSMAINQWFTNMY